jgi:hypothetical protein
MTTNALSVNPTSRKRDVPAMKSGRLSALRSDRYAVGGTTPQRAGGHFEALVSASHRRQRLPPYPRKSSPLHPGGQIFFHTGYHVASHIWRLSWLKWNPMQEFSA